MKRYVYVIIGIVLLLVVWAALSGKSNSGRMNAESAGMTEGASDASGLYLQAKALLEEGEKVDAKKLYQQILAEYPDFEEISQVQRDLEALNMRIMFSNTITPGTVIHEVQSGDSLGKLAKKYGTTIALIKQRNNLKSDIIRLGQKLYIWTGDLNIFVDKSQNILMLKDGDEILKVYNVSTGANNSTPVGEFTVKTKLVDPVWFNRGVVVPPESPENVLGSRWLGFDLAGYGIHGTVEPETIGQQVTAGCVRMRNKEVEELYTIVPLGTKVVIVD